MPHLVFKKHDKRVLDPFQFILCLLEMVSGLQAQEKDPAGTQPL